ncbi:uncharacterized protein LOC134519889 isoform X3 [Chroicocephalus ridibundus]
MQRWPPGPEPSPSPRSLRGRARHRRRGGLDPAAAFQIAQVKLGFAQKRLVSAVQSRDAGSRSVVMLPQREALPFSSSGHSFPKPRRSQTRGEEGAGTASLQGGFGEDRDLCHASSIHAPANRVVSEQDSALTGVVRNVTGSHGRCKPDSRHLLAVPRRRSAYESACENIGARLPALPIRALFSVTNEAALVCEARACAAAEPFWGRAALPDNASAPRGARSDPSPPALCHRTRTL